jgi:hypothetical protein
LTEEEKEEERGLEKRLAEREERVRQAKARQVEFERLYAEAEKAIHERPAPPKWIDIQAQLQSQYDNLPSTRTRLARERKKQFDKLYADTKATLTSNKDSVTPWAQSLLNSQAKLQSRLEHIHDSTTVRGSKSHSNDDKGANAEKSIDKLFAETEAMLHKKTRVVSPWAQNLMDTQADLQSKLDHLHDGQKRSSKLRGSARTNTGAGGLKWIPVEYSNKHNEGAINHAVPLAREQLRHAKWEGKVPSISCIMAVPPSPAAKVHFKYAINNFKLQHYEGDLELVVVYQHGDNEAASLVQQFAEKERIRGVASRGIVPSTMALRYGAWTSKADLIAQWDYEAWHHPDRLSMQVRALAMSRHPGSLVVDPKSQNSTTGLKIQAMEGSLIGQAGWMREHWHPLLDEENGLLEMYQSHNIAFVDAPALAIDNHHTALVPNASSPSVLATDGGHDTLESLGIEACRSILEDKTLPTAASRDESVVSNALRNVTDKLKALCMETHHKTDPKERSFMHHHCGTIESARRKLDARLSFDKVSE